MGRDVSSPSPVLHYSTMIVVTCKTAGYKELNNRSLKIFNVQKLAVMMSQ